MHEYQPCYISNVNLSALRDFAARRMETLATKKKKKKKITSESRILVHLRLCSLWIYNQTDGTAMAGSFS